MKRSDLNYCDNPKETLAINIYGQASSFLFKGGAKLWTRLVLFSLAQSLCPNFRSKYFNLKRIKCIFENLVKNYFLDKSISVKVLRYLFMFLFYLSVGFTLEYP